MADPNPPTASSQQSTRTAKSVVQGAVQTHSNLIDFLYRERCCLYNENMAKLEESTGAKREVFVYTLMAALAVYLMLGKNAQFVCNLLTFIYPAYMSLKALASNNKEEMDALLVYWSAYGFFATLDPIFYNAPFYFLVKTMLLLSLLTPDMPCLDMLRDDVMLPVSAKLQAIFE